MKPKEVIEKAYSNVPKEPLPTFDFDLSLYRPLKYYWVRFLRFFTR